MLGNPTTTTISISSTQGGSGGGGGAFPSTDPNQNSNPDLYSNGPSVYLYGFLATLVLIFLISIGVAWKGYHTRRLLRARIDEAIARGVLIPGYDPSNPNLPFFPTTTTTGTGTYGSRLRNGQVMQRPVLFEEWIGEKALGEGEGWDIKPTALDVLRPYDATPLNNTTTTSTTRHHHHSSHANSLFNQLLDPLRQYWFVQPPEGAEADQLQGRPGRRGRGGRGRGRGRDERTEALNRLEEDQREKKKMEDSAGLLGVSEVVASVFIAMPDRGHPAWGVRRNGSGGAARHNGGIGGVYGAVASGSRPSSWQQQQQQQQKGVASGSRPTSISVAGHTTTSHGASNSIGTAAAVLEVERKEELPELVLGVVLVGLKEEAVEAVEEEDGAEEEEGPEGEDGGKGEGEGRGKGKGVGVDVPLDNGIADNGKVVEGNGGAEKGKELAVTSSPL